MARLTSMQDLAVLRDEIKAKKDKRAKEVAICTGTGCLGLGAAKVYKAFQSEILKRGLQGDIRVKETGCPGFCQRGTIAVVTPPGVYYLGVQPSDVVEIIEETLLCSRLVDRLLYSDPFTGQKAVREEDIPFYRHQSRLLIKNNIKIDPKNICDYIKLGGYEALARVLSGMTPQQVIDEIKKSGRAATAYS